MAAATRHTLAAEASVSAVCPLLSVQCLVPVFGLRDVGAVSSMPSLFNRSLVAFISMFKRTSSYVFFSLRIDCSIIPPRFLFPKRQGTSPLSFSPKGMLSLV